MTSVTIIEIIAAGGVTVFCSLVVWSIRDLKSVIVNNTKEVNELKVEFAKLQIMVSHGGKRIEKLEADNDEQWKHIRKQQQTKGD